jgi:hypothetical protein
VSGSRWTVIRNNVIAAIKALPLYDPAIPVYALGVPPDIFGMGTRVALGVCLSQDIWLDVDSALSYYVDREAEMNIPIVILTTSEASPAGALEEAGMIDDLTAMILGTAVGPMTGPGLRSADVGVAGETGGVYLRSVTSTLVPGPDRALGAGGALAKVILMRTTSVPL